MKQSAALSNLPFPVRQLLSQIGPKYADDIRRNRDLVVDAFTPLLRDASKQGVVVTRNIPYGPHARHLLDIFAPKKKSAHALPVIFFVHGGAFVRGNKDVNEELYANVPTWFARNGFVGINLEYRLAPESSFPGGADDLACAIAWGQASLAQYGGDPRRIFLVGHSAGGTHVAHYAFDPGLGYVAKNVRAIALISARLRVDTSLKNPNSSGVRAYFGDTETEYEVLSPITHISTESVPTFVAVAEYENPLLDAYGAELFYRLRAAGHSKNRFMQLVGHNHMSIVAHFNTEEEMLGNSIVNFFSAVEG